MKEPTRIRTVRAPMMRQRRRGEAGPQNCPQSQATSESTSSTHRTCMCFSTGRMESRYRAVPSRKKPRTRSKTFIQLPGRGRMRASWGQMLNRMYGRAMPRPTAQKTTIRTSNGWVKAQPSTPPSSGPLHGVARKVETRPVR